ncbi:MAG: DUF4345 domain-containing protein [bacterium]|nr:DUF4345 domain-containing protein [bacterium]
MDLVMEWLPRLGALLTAAIGTAGFFKPTLITDGCDIELKSAKALSEARGVFGGIMLGAGGTALVLGDPNVYLALGLGWAGATLARFVSIALDGSTLKESIPPIVVDGTAALLLLSSQL